MLYTVLMSQAGCIYHHGESEHVLQQRAFVYIIIHYYYNKEMEFPKNYLILVLTIIFKYAFHKYAN